MALNTYTFEVFCGLTSQVASRWLPWKKKALLSIRGPNHNFYAIMLPHYPAGTIAIGCHKHRSISYANSFVWNMVRIAENRCYKHFNGGLQTLTMVLRFIYMHLRGISFLLCID